MIAFVLVRVIDISAKSAGNLSSITIFIPYFFAASTTPARTSSENGSFSKAIATLTEEGSLPAALALAAANSIAGAKYCSDVERTAKRYL